MGGLRLGVRKVYSFFFSSRRRHTRCLSDWSSDVCSSDLRNACFGRRPLLAGNGERSPPPPPPPMAFCLGAASGGGARSMGEIRGTYCFTLSCTALEDNTVKSRTANRTWPPVDIANDFFWRP